MLTQRLAEASYEEKLEELKASGRIEHNRGQCGFEIQNSE